MKLFSKHLTPFVFFLSLSFIAAQDPHRFESEVKSIVEKNKNTDSQSLILFTGSSSVRMWSTLKDDFPDRNVMNNGFGGSEMSDLLYYADQLIIQYQPIQVLIYEGDNDINSGRELDVITKNFRSLLELLQQKLPTTKVSFIAAKPSVARWSLKEKYIRFNESLKNLAGEYGADFIDVWTPMLNENNEVRDDLFVKDNLHMNETGYSIWRKTIAPYLLKP